MSNFSPDKHPAGERLMSLDFFRGLVMFLLIVEFTDLYNLLQNSAFDGTIIYFIGEQFHHHPWNGLRFWDLIQPSFMFIVGVAIPFSFHKRTKRGESYPHLLRHALIRSLVLFVLGWALYCIAYERIVLRFTNVLTQLSVTYLVTFLLIRKPLKIQFIVSIALLVFAELMYRLFSIEGFNQPFVPDHNFGTWFDLLYGGEVLRGHWVAFNAIPTTAHTIWGAMAGKLLMSNRSSQKKVKILLIIGAAGLLIGYGLNPVTPIIKRISTTTFVLASGGWTLFFLAFSYWLIDMKKQRRLALFFTIVGMNPLFIYLFAHMGGASFIEHIIHPFSAAVFGWTGELPAEIITSCLVVIVLWYICYWLYKRKIYIKI